MKLVAPFLALPHEQIHPLGAELINSELGLSTSSATQPQNVATSGSWLAYPWGSSTFSGGGTTRAYQLGGKRPAEE